MKRFIFCLFLLAVPCFAGELIKGGTTFTPKNDMMCFPMDEAGRILQDLKSAKALQQQVELFQQNENLYKEQIKMWEQLNSMRKDSVTEYREAVKLLQEVMVELKNASAIYKEVIDVQGKALKFQAEKANQVARTRRWERNLNFLAGLLAPIGGAWGFSRVR